MNWPTRIFPRAPSVGPSRGITAVLAAGVLQPLFWTYKGLAVGKRYAEFSRLQWSSEADLRYRQERMLRALLSHALEQIPAYQKMQSAGMSRILDKDVFCALSSFPITEKTDISAKANEFCREMGRGTFRNSTGGSTGAPVSFLQDNSYQAANLASSELLFAWAGVPRGALSIKLWGATRDLGDGKARLRSLLVRAVHNQVVLNCFVLTDELMEEYLAAINRLQPVIIEAYVDGIYELAKFLDRSRLHVNYQLGGIIVSAGTLLPHMRAVIEQAFGAPVFNRYGSREAGGIASECTLHRGLHVMGETTLVEVVDANGVPAAAGEEGDILVTNLWNHTMPLIRYRIGDRGVRSAETCGCGRPYPLLAAVNGRCSLALRRRDGVVSPVFFAHVMGVLHNDGSVAKFQIVQEAYDRITVRLVPRRGEFNFASWDKRELITKELQTLMGDKCEVEFKLEKEIEITPTGKHLYTICRISEASGSGT